MGYHETPRTLGERYPKRAKTYGGETQELATPRGLTEREWRRQIIQPHSVPVFLSDGVFHWPKATQSQQAREPFDIIPKGQSRVDLEEQTEHPSWPLEGRVPC